MSNGRWYSYSFVCGLIEQMKEEDPEELAMYREFAGDDFDSLAWSVIEWNERREAMPEGWFQWWED